MTKYLLSLTAAALVVPAAPALAAGSDQIAEASFTKIGDRYDDRVYDKRGRYIEPRALRRDDRVWKGRDGRYYCKRDNGTTGLIIGGAVGALLGREIDGGRDRTLGTILGAAGGALLGREIDRGDLKCR